jgi:TolB protein
MMAFLNMNCINMISNLKEIRLTYFGEYAGKPVVSADGETIYFILDKNFGKRTSDYHLYKMNKNGEQIKKLISS